MKNSLFTALTIDEEASLSGGKTIISSNGTARPGTGVGTPGKVEPGLGTTIESEIAGEKGIIIEGLTIELLL